MGGGCPFVACSLYINQHILTQGTSRVLLHTTRVKRHRNGAKRGQKLIFICSVLSYPRNFGDNERQKAKNIFESGCKVSAGCGSAWLPFGVSTGAEVFRLSMLQDLPELALVLWCAFPAFYPLYGFACGVLCLNMALFRVLRAFLAWFGVVVWVCVVLVVFVACVAFVRVWS